MKRRLTGLIICLAFALLSASAQGAVGQFSAYANPSSLNGAGTVEINFSITNTSADVAMTGITVTGPGVNSTIGDLSAGSSRTPKISAYNISANQLDTPIAFTFSWLENGVPQSSVVNVIVATDRSEPKLDVSRTADKTSATTGAKVVLSYTLTNSGNMPLTDITLKDAGISDSAIITGLSLAPGEKKSVDYTYTVGDKTATSQPLVTYKYDGGSQEVKLDPLEITAAKAQLSVTVAASDPTAGGVTFTITLKNTGTVDIKDIKVTDELGKAASGSAFTLAVGEQKELTHNIVPVTTRNVVFSVNGTDATGQPYTYQTRSVEAKPYVDASSVKLELNSKLVQTLASGKVKVAVDIINSGEVELNDVVLSEAAQGELQKLAALAPGTKTVDLTLDADDISQLSFKVEAKDSAGNTYTAESTLPLTQDAPSTPSAQVTEPGADETQELDTEAPSPRSALMTIVIILIALIVITAAALIILTLNERNRNKRTRSHTGHDPRLGNSAMKRPDPTLDPPEFRRVQRPPAQPTQRGPIDPPNVKPLESNRPEAAKPDDTRRVPRREPVRKEPTKREPPKRDPRYDRPRDAREAPKPPQRPVNAPARPRPERIDYAEPPSPPQPQIRYEDIDDYGNYDDDYTFNGGQGAPPQGTPRFERDAGYYGDTPEREPRQTKKHWEDDLLDD